MLKRIFLLGLLSILCCSSLLSKDTLRIEKSNDTQTYYLKNGAELTYKKPKFYKVFTNVPKDFYAIGKQTATKKGLYCLGAVALSTLAILPFDQQILDKSHQFGNHIGLESERRFGSLVSFKHKGESVDILQHPQNINTTLYYLGEGLPSLLIGLGVMSYGYYKNDYRAISTAFQLYEAFIVLGVTTQAIKRITGRQSPFVATQDGGKWSGFPGFSEYQSHVPHYDAYPSGHLTTVMATITILSENYPEYRLIKPVGYTIMGLIGYSMMHNGVHWFSDYPLALALGYAYGKIISNRQIIKKGGLLSRTTLYPKVMPFGGYGVGLSFSLN